jgi:hypothetical protein
MDTSVFERLEVIDTTPSSPAAVAACPIKVLAVPGRCQPREAADYLWALTS